MRLSNDSLIPEYKFLTQIVHEQNCPVIAQLALGGFYENNNLIEPDEMSDEQIKYTIKLFLDAAIRAKNQILTVFRFMRRIFSF